jgi:hypothetical protein
MRLGDGRPAGGGAEVSRARRPPGPSPGLAWLDRAIARAISGEWRGRAARDALGRCGGGRGGEPRAFLAVRCGLNKVAGGEEF